ncbi:BAH domain-containing protein [Mycena kentingensis (nom. inval.)]|nr:BAH domain-containing protein [Mycena kentingensis (nom. inval.)]
MPMVPYVLVPPRSPQKRRSPSPDSEPEPPSPNLSPRKRPRNDHHVVSSVSALSRVSLRASPTASEAYLTSITPETVSGSDEGEVFTGFDDEEYVEEADLPALFEDTGDVDEGRPVRSLASFALFQAEHGKMILPHALDVDKIPEGHYCAVGLVSELLKDSEDDASDDDDVPPTQHLVKLDITGFSAHFFDPESSDLDEKVYIETAFSYYVLEAPLPEYRPYWVPFHRKHQIAHSIISAALEDPDATYEDWFMPNTLWFKLSEYEAERDAQVAYIVQAIWRVLDAKAPIGQVPLVNYFVGDIPIEQRHRPLKMSKFKSSKAPSLDGPTVVTKIVGRIVAQHLNSKISVVGEAARSAKARAKAIEDRIVHLGHPKKVKWLEEDDVQIQSVEVDGAVYKLGDIVAVQPGDDDNRNRRKYERINAGHCVNVLANKAWFVRIQYFYESASGSKYFHGQWLVHGSRTLLQELSHSQELMEINECADIAVGAILQKCMVHEPAIDEEEEPDERDPANCDYFMRYRYDSQAHDFLSLPTQEEINELYFEVSKSPHRRCPNCARRKQLKHQTAVRAVGTNGLTRFGQVLHQHDFVYVLPDADTANRDFEVLFIAQIISVDIAKKRVKLQYYDRDRSDSRRLHRTSHRNVTSVENLDLDTRPFVLDCWTTDENVHDKAAKWVAADTNNFFTCLGPDDEELRQCDKCVSRYREELDAAPRLVRQRGKLPVLELFAGAGGLSQGLCQSDFFTTATAVEWSWSAAETFRLNHPETTVLSLDVNTLLRYIVQREEGKEQPLLRGADGNEIPDASIPRPHEFEMLCGGPPCQSFSLMNTRKFDGDPRSALPFTMLSLAEVLNPNYFLLENVTGLLNHKEKHSVLGKPIEKAMLKLIARILLSLNYQFRPVSCQAGQHGCVQTRGRFFAFGAKRGRPMPDAPIPMYAFKPAQRSKLFMDDDYLFPARRGCKALDAEHEDGHNFAPHAGLTFRDATSDLPRFDWIDPFNIRDKGPDDSKKIKKRIAKGIRQFDASEAPVGFTEPVPYATPPQTRYQAQMRSGNLTHIQYHYTNSYSANVVEAVCSLPIIPEVNHTSLPKAFHHLWSPKKRSKCFGRLDQDQACKTALTSVSPTSHGSQVIHPIEKRTISVIEGLRGQGFPDHFIVWSNAKTERGKIVDYYKHIGNAVPVPLAASVSRCFERAILKSLPPQRAESEEL